MINRLSNPIDRNRSAAKISKVMSSTCYVFYIDLQMLIQVELEDQQTKMQIPCVDTNINTESD